MKTVGRASVVATFRVINEGSRGGRSTCRITAEDPQNTPIRSQSVLTRPIRGGGAVFVRHTLTQLPLVPDHLQIDCT
jgi:hypothetical protein